MPRRKGPKSLNSCKPSGHVHNTAIKYLACCLLNYRGHKAWIFPDVFRIVMLRVFHLDLIAEFCMSFGGRPWVLEKAIEQWRGVTANAADKIPNFHSSNTFWGCGTAIKSLLRPPWLQKIERIYNLSWSMIFRENDVDNRSTIEIDQRSLCGQGATGSKHYGFLKSRWFAQAQAHSWQKTDFCSTLKSTKNTFKHWSCRKKSSVPPLSLPPMPASLLSA